MTQLRTRSQTGPILAVAFLAVAGLALIGAYFYLSRQPAVADSGWVDPQALARGSSIAPDLAVLTLAGEPDDRIIRASLDANERETAYATLAYGMLIPDAVRGGQWLVMANAFADDPGRAAVAYQAAMDIAALGPALNDQGRASISLQASRGYQNLDRPALAALAVAQAENIARYSLTLLPAQRRDLLNQVATAYDRLEQRDEAARVRSNLAAYSAGPGVVVEPASPLLPTLRGAVTLPADVTGALAERQQAAARLAASWLDAQPAERDALTAQLGDALVAEDAARGAFYATAADLPLADRLALLHDRINWLSIKLRALKGGYGVSLAPEWEQGRAEIEAELSQAYIDLVNGYGQQLDTLDPVEALTARVELLRGSMQSVRLGLFGDQTVEESLRQQLTEASRELWQREGGAGLTIVSQDEQGLLLYLLAGADPNK
jgi:hypothetical protein